MERKEKSTCKSDGGHAIAPLAVRDVVLEGSDPAEQTRIGVSYIISRFGNIALSRRGLGDRYERKGIPIGVGVVGDHG